MKAKLKTGRLPAVTEAPRRISPPTKEELEKMLEVGIKELDAGKGIPGDQAFAELKARARHRPDR